MILQVVEISMTYDTLFLVVSSDWFSFSFPFSNTDESVGISLKVGHHEMDFSM